MAALADRSFRSDRVPLATLLLVGGALTAWWTVFDLARLATFHLYVYDLGVSYQAIWAAAHGFRTDAAGPNGYRLIFYAFVPAFDLLPSQTAFFQFLLAFQNAFLFLGALPLYLVARDRLGSRLAATAIALAYLLYIPLNGPLWFPFHEEPIWATIFLFAYWRYRALDYVSAGALFLLGFTTNVGASLVTIAFGLGVVLEPQGPRVVGWLRDVWRRRPHERTPWTPALVRRTGFGLALIAAATATLAIVAAIYGFWNILFFIGQVSFTGGSGAARAFPLNPFTDLPVKGWTIVIEFAPLLLLPLFAREERWGVLPLLVPALLTANHPQFLFPFKLQYSAFVYPFLLVGTVRGLERWADRRRVRPDGSGRFPRVLPKARRWNRELSVPRRAVLVFVAVAIVGLFFAPWSPGDRVLLANSPLSSGYYPLAANTYANASVDAHLRQLLALIPPPAPVLFQNNLPELMNRSAFYIPGFFTPATRISYLVNDPYNLAFYEGQNFGPDPGGMVDWSNYFLDDPAWGVVGAVDGALLLGANYSGPPLLYDPLYESFTANNFPCCHSGTWNGTGRSGFLVEGPSVPFDGQFQTYCPGSFNFTFTFDVTNPSASDALRIDLGGAGGGTLLDAFSVTAAGWTNRSGDVALTVPVSFHGYFPGMFVGVYVLQWKEPITFESLVIQQVAPPTTPPRAGSLSPPPGSLATLVQAVGPAEPRRAAAMGRDLGLPPVPGLGQAGTGLPPASGPIVLALTVALVLVRMGSTHRTGDRGVRRNHTPRNPSEPRAIHVP